MGEGYTVDRGAWVESDLGVKGSRFGKYIGSGGEQTVYEDLVNPDKVLKIYNDTKVKDLSELKKLSASLNRRNQVPLQEPINMEGFITRGNYLYPVYSQNKLKTLDMPSAEFRKSCLPLIKNELLPFGYQGDGINSPFTDGTRTLIDIKPEDIGVNPEGKLRFFDVDLVE